MVDIAAEGARLAIYTAQRLKLYERLIAALRKKHRVIVLGSTGVGKTSLINSLTEWMPEAIDYMNRTARSAKHHIKIKDDHFEFVDTPGQEQHVGIRTAAIDESFKRSVSGIVNVVAYGFHEYRRPTDDGIFTQSGSVSQRFLNRHRRLELEMLTEWTSRVLTHRISPWIMTVMSKADYWWGNRHNVYDHYMSPKFDYAKAISVIPDAQHTVHEYCSTIHKFYGQHSPREDFDRTDVQFLKTALLADLIDAIGRIQ